MRDYWLTQYILAAVGWGYVLLSLAAIALALWLPKGKRAKAIAALIVVGLASILPLQGYQGYQKQKEAAESHRARQAGAQALFKERCKTAGERIHKTVENVEGVLLLDVRSGDKAGQRGNPNWPDAALPNEVGGDDYIRHFLYWEHNGRPGQRGYLNSSATNATSRGYKFADVRQADGRTVRYTLVDPDSNAPKLKAETLNGKPARYSIGFENFVDPADRKFWVAGTKVTITDSSTGELLAQKIWYSFEPGLGSTDNFRKPWGFANTCPALAGWNAASTRFFVDQVLKPKQGN